MANICYILIGENDELDLIENEVSYLIRSGYVRHTDSGFLELTDAVDFDYVFDLVTRYRAIAGDKS